MEGIGYWIFLLALYLISTLAKKRKQKSAWEALDKEEENQEDTRSKPDFIEQFFGDLVSKEEKPVISEIEPDPEEVYAEEETPIETESIPPEVEADLSHPSFETYESHVDERHVGTISHWDLPEKKSAGESLESILGQLKGKTNLRRAIILKEILEKPLALRD
ncbi:MAG: hypothetical protein QF859_07670 [Candidatus Marinimicrobia bacterium]|jgi:hypothetical protein|nr:hypothetical protein [Candidatus Neomarinimicrobiota bacterium]MDP6261031.1 hypothetical protein [Candidatus Neomarinimicrobiota bacterium]MDP7126957.1 hypothetical protein [Candidatus Neomarinimicrobiota bacterium]MDP7475824.1 hypothetical protein [Candidatus Neomarinimicrobiota bacterium]MEE1505554.1 hypothetical protein [Candidatus Neomarinimicrobiota bacterium]|tara:strand:+ start:623 stop:1111 length:489 start_codon:yes stop_codon:yes gene_type:complete